MHIECRYSVVGPINSSGLTMQLRTQPMRTKSLKLYRSGRDHS